MGVETEMGELAEQSKPSGENWHRTCPVCLIDYACNMQGQGECPNCQPQYPEHEKLAAISADSQRLGEFIDWLQNERGVTLCMRHERRSNPWDEDYQPAGWFPIFKSVQDWLAEYYEIDLVKLESEKRAMLAGLAKAQGR